MKALILNSGVGRRMGIMTQQQPKCMTSIGDGHTILSWQLELLKKAGISDIVITTGPFEQELRAHVREHMPSGVVYVHNPLYQKTNYIYSMYLARKLLEDDLILLHGDLVLEASVLEYLIRTPQSAVTLADGLPLPEKDFKARVLDGRVREIGVNVFGGDCIACQPAYKLLRADMLSWLNAIEAFCLRGETGVYAENALNTIFEHIEMRPVMLHGRLCNEIDNQDDLAAVSKRFIDYRGMQG